MLMIGSICWPMIDTYYIVLFFALSLAKNKNVEESKVAKDVQWIAETLFTERKIQYFESCNQPAIQNAVARFLEMKVLVKIGIFLNLGQDYQDNGNKKLHALIDQVGRYRMKPTSQTLLEEIDPSTNIRRSIFNEFPFMAKL